MNTGYYSPEEWANLSAQQRNEVLTARGTNRNTSAVDSNSYSYYAAVVDNISGLTPGDHTYVSYLSDDHEHNEIDFSNSTPTYAHASIHSARTSANAQTSTVSGNAGNQFGQHSHNMQTEPNHFIGMFRSSI